MKKTILIFTILLVNLFATSQVLYPKGCYMSFKEVLTKTPSEDHQLAIKKRTNFDIKMNGGNDYKLISANNTIKREFLKKKIFAYSTGDSLFINCLKYRLQAWYTNVVSDGKYLVFTAGIPMDKDMQTKAMQEEIQLGMSFGVVVGAFSGASLAMERYLYILNKETNNIVLINNEVMNDVLKDFPDLLEQYNSENGKNEISVRIEYLNLLNKKYE